jgi:phage shock protein A
MSIWKRLWNLFRYRSHAALDRVENPGAAARLKARDYAAQVAKFEEQLASVLAEEKTLEKKHEEAQASISVWKERARQAVLGSRDDLAKQALTRQAAAETQVQSLQEILGRISVTTAALRQRLDALRQARAEAQTAAEVIDARAKAVAATEHSIRLLHSIGEGPQINFTDLQNEVERREAHAEALQELAEPDAATDLRLLESPSVDSRLEQLKAEIRSDSVVP